MTTRRLVVDALDVLPFSIPGDEFTYESQAVITPDGSGSADLTVNRFTLKAERSLPGHIHPNNDELYYILHGRGVLTLRVAGDLEADETFEVRPDVAAFIPAGTFHRLQNENDDDLVLLTIWPRMPEPGSNPIYDARRAAWGTTFRVRSRALGTVER